METPNYEQLFLLEVLVNHVKLSTSSLHQTAIDQHTTDDPVRVRVQFAELPCFEITQDLAPPDKLRAVGGKDGDGEDTKILHFKSGKSYLFAMDPEQLLTNLELNPLAVTVFTRKIDMAKPDLIGQSQVLLIDKMRDIVQRACQWELQSPVSEAVQDSFQVSSLLAQHIGFIDLLVRLTCFGKTIVTKFQLANNNKSFFFKNAKMTDDEFRCEKCEPGKRRKQGMKGHESAREEGNESDECLETCGQVEERNNDQCGIMECTNQPRKPSQRECKVEEREGRDSCKPCGGQVVARNSCDERCEHIGDMKPSPRGSEKLEEETNSGSGGTKTQRYHMKAPGVTASMQLKINKDNMDVEVEMSDWGGQHEGGDAGLGEVDVEKENRENENKQRKKKPKGKYMNPGDLAYPGVVLGHKSCVGSGGAVPARNGWAWKTTIPEGMKPEDLQGWRPGCFMKQCWRMIQEVKNRKIVTKKKNRFEEEDNRLPNVTVRRVDGVYHVTMNPPQGPEDKEPPEPITYTVEPPGGADEDDSDLELNLTIPQQNYKPRPPVKHQAQQFCDSDLPLIEPKKKIRVASKATKKGKDKKKSKGNRSKSASSSASGKSGKNIKVGKDGWYPWDNWILKVNCKKKK